MFIDLTFALKSENLSKHKWAQKIYDSGHIGTHFDVMNKVFPLESFRTKGKIIDISHIRHREVGIPDLSGHIIEEGDMVIFHTGYIDELGFGTDAYIPRSAELSDEAVAYLVDHKVRLIGVDAVGVQEPKKHKAVDQYCADRGVFIVENLANLKELLARSPKNFTVFTAPMNRTDWTGLPCRVVAELSD
jgi:kynurenine formamidase